MYRQLNYTLPLPLVHHNSHFYLDWLYFYYLLAFSSINIVQFHSEPLFMPLSRNLSVGEYYFNWDMMYYICLCCMCLM